MPDARAQAFEDSRLYFVTPLRPGGGDLLATVTAAISGGATVIQLRDKHASDDEILAAAALIKPVCAQSGSLLIINDRPDLAVAAAVDGVHVGQDDAAINEARKIVGPDMLVGLSTHDQAQIDASADSGADYVGVGPVYATPTKAGRPPVGVELISYAAASSRLPFVAIGGIDRSNAALVAAAGASRIAVVRAVADASDPELAARELVSAITP